MLKKLVPTTLAAALIATSLAATQAKAEGVIDLGGGFVREHSDVIRVSPGTAMGPPAATLVPDAAVRPRGGGHSGDHGAAFAAGIMGLAAGAMLGAASAQPRHTAPSGYNQWLAYCSARYRSFNPATGMYRGYDGYLHPCRM